MPRANASTRTAHPGRLHAVDLCMHACRSGTLGVGDILVHTKFYAFVLTHVGMRVRVVTIAYAYR